MAGIQELQFIFGPREYDFQEEEEEGDVKKIKKYIDWYADYDKVFDSTFSPFEYSDQPLTIEEEASEKTIISSSSYESAITLTQSTRIRFGVDEGHPCLAEILISDSKLKFDDINSFYAIPEDPGIFRAFWTLYPLPPSYASDGVDRFFDTIESMGLAPIESLKYQLYDNKIDLKFYGVDPEAIKPLTEALKRNKTVESLDLQDNSLSEDACYYLNILLYKSNRISHLNLCACKIGPEGAARLEAGISSSPSLICLNLSRCEIGNQGLVPISRAIIDNVLLKRLDISDNNLDEESASSLKTMITNSNSLEYLNLAWNNFTTRPVASSLFSSLINNTSITELDLSWNSMGKETIGPLCNFISNSKIIKKLHLEGNRYTDDDLMSISKVLLKNESLEELGLAGNPFYPAGITEFIRSLGKDEFFNTPLKFINFECLWAKKECNSTLVQLKEMKPKFSIKLAGILENYIIVGPDLKELFFLTANHDAMKPKKKKDRKDFGQFVISLPDDTMKLDKFITTVEESGLKISENLAKQIAKLFLVTKKTMDPKALKDSYLEYFPDTEIPQPTPEPDPVKEKKDKKHKKDKKQKQKKGGKGKSNKKKTKA